MPIPEFRGQGVLVTGGAGFIGSHLVAALVDRGAAVRVLDDFSTGKRSNLEAVSERIETVEGDIRDRAACRQACEGVRFVFHEAARGSVPRSLADPAGTLDVNVLGTANVFLAARDAGAERVVYASSSSVYGDSNRLPKREGEEGRPLSPYALSKKMNEETAEVFFRCFGLATVGLRYFNVYGPRQDPAGPYAAVIPRFFAACRDGQSPVIYGDGHQSRDFTFVADAVRANLLAAGASEGALGRAVNVAGGVGTTVLELAGAVRTATGKGSPPRHEPRRAGDVEHSLADLADAARLLGYGPGVDFVEGLATCARFYAGATRGESR